MNSWVESCLEIARIYGPVAAVLTALCAGFAWALWRMYLARVKDLKERIEELRQEKNEYRDLLLKHVYPKLSGEGLETLTPKPLGPDDGSKGAKGMKP